MNNQYKNHTSIFFAGHFAIDTIIRFKHERKPSLGGSVSYCSLALSTYTKDVNISIISNLGKLNFNDHFLDIVRNRNINLEGIKWSDTNNTNFVLDYFNHSRTLTLKSRSPNLSFEDLPQKYLNNPPEVIVLVPLCSEITYDYVSKILEHFPNTYIGIDLQGFLRKIDDQGIVSYILDEQIISNMNNIMNLIGERLILKGSEVEMKLLSNKDDLNEVMNYFHDSEFKGLFIMTLGESGSMITKQGYQTFKIPAFKSRSVIDETGAGDVYLAIFLYEFICSDKSWEAVKKAAYLASSAASFLVERNGPDGFEAKDKIIERVNNRNYNI